MREEGGGGLLSKVGLRLFDGPPTGMGSGEVLFDARLVHVRSAILLGVDVRRCIGSMGSEACDLSLRSRSR